MKKNKGSYRRKINTILLVSITICFVIMTSAIYVNVDRTVRNIFMQNVNQQVMNTKRLIESEIEKNLMITDLLSKIEALEDTSMSLKEKDKVIGALYQNYEREYHMASLGYIDQKGNMIVSDGYTGNVSDQEYYEILMTGEEYVSGLLSNDYLGIQTIFIGKPVITDGEVTGAVTCSLT